MLIRRFDSLQGLEHHAAEILQRFPDLQRRKSNVCGCEGLTVMPFDAITQAEGCGQTVTRTFPTDCKARLQTVFTVEGSFGQRLDYLARHEENAVGSDNGRIEIAWLGICGNDQSPTFLRSVFGPRPTG